MDVLDLDVWAALRSYATYSTQNSLPSGSRITVRSAPASTAVAPRETRRATSNRTSPCARRSKCMRFLAVFGSGTRTNHMFGPPQPGASTLFRSCGAVPGGFVVDVGAERVGPEPCHNHGVRAVEGDRLDVNRHQLKVAARGATLGRRDHLYGAHRGVHRLPGGTSERSQTADGADASHARDLRWFSTVVLIAKSGWEGHW